ncbi:MAG: hypothetical protein ACM3SW_02975 [Actinomycetota bacterium]
MPKIRILAIYTVIDLLIGVGVVWCVLRGISVSRYLIPATALFVLNGVWLLVMVIRTTPPGNLNTRDGNTETRRKPFRH